MLTKEFPLTLKNQTIYSIEEQVQNFVSYLVSITILSIALKNSSISRQGLVLNMFLELTP
ncbi:MAG: hypothetical protein ACI8ZM_004744 [Crocinitomix sp.]|jgi:hypothetical protein